MSRQRGSRAQAWWHWRGFIAFGLVLLGAALFVVARRDLLAALLMLLVLSGTGLATCPFWISGIWLSRRWREKRRARYLVLAPLVSAPALILIPVLAYLAAHLTARNGLLAGQDRYVVLIVVDGGSFERALELFEEAARDDERYREEINRAFPNISKLFLGEGAYTLNGVTIWPASSVPANTSIITGAYPRKSDIVGQRYYERSLRHHMSYIGPGITALNNELSTSVKTIYEYFPEARSVAIVQICNRGCSLYVPGQPDDDYAERAWEWAVMCLNGLGQRTGVPGIPRLTVITFAHIDNISHTTYLDSPKAVEAYINVDRLIGRMTAFLASRDLLDKTTIVLTSDHGIAPVTNHLTIDRVLEDLRFDTFQSLKYLVKTDWGMFESNFWKGGRRDFDKRYNCVALWGGNSDALLYFKGQHRDAQGAVVRSSWDILPTQESLENYHCGGEDINVIERLLQHSPGIRFVITHPAPNEYLVYTLEGVSRIAERPLNQIDAAYRYDVLWGEDPLEYADAPTLKPYVNTGLWLTDREWLDLTCTLHYPDALHRLANSFGSPRSADLHLVAADGWDFTPAGVSRKVLTGSHGGLDRKQSMVPIMFWGRGIKRAELLTGRTVDILPTILELLDVQYDPAAVSGRPLDVLE
ncbi:MAG: alkaline phosphatase family protein [Anaerolineae bacterium]|nr:alkaline phosphatase family protein [Anaerolineae bacterium]